MTHSVLVAVHATAATIAWLAGLVALREGRLFSVHRGAQVVMAVALAAAVVVGWSGYTPVTRIVFPGLLVLAVAMIVRTELAARERPGTTGAVTAGYVDHLGFALISLSVGFVLIALLNAGVPVWVAVTVGVATVLAGRVGVRTAQRRWVTAPV